MGVEESRARRAARVSPGARVGEYVLERALGAGAMGAVYVGRHVGSGARHALKVLHLGAGAERRERFAREARALAKVDRHPGVVRIHRYDVEPDGLAYCALELVLGGDLERRLEAHPAGLPLPAALAIGEGLARALAHVHAAGVVHRDLKPANVLLPGDGDAPVLTDFGVARDEAEERLTRSQQLVGTPFYMAPEQLLGDQGRVGPATDVFALGVLLYQALTGALPFEGEGLLELTRAVCEDEPPLPRARRPDLPRDLDAIVLRALDKAPERRPGAGQVADWLAAVARGEALGLRGSSAVDRVVRRLRRRRPALAAAAAGLLVVAGLAGAARWALADPARDLARSVALQEALAEAARLDPGRLERLLAGAAPDPALVAARERLAALLRPGDAEAAAAAAALDEALAAAAAEAALARRAEAARAALGRLGQGEAQAPSRRARPLAGRPAPPAEALGRRSTRSPPMPRWRAATRASPASTWRACATSRWPRGGPSRCASRCRAPRRPRRAWRRRRSSRP
ncbi:MAG: serine/threonine protein kinase [Planctomycetes bacterium]|nr:serine/threonine protein kinase [Planctomycetota bacterium]